jgi:hypothetical protein
MLQVHVAEIERMRDELHNMHRLAITIRVGVASARAAGDALFLVPLARVPMD